MSATLSGSEVRNILGGQTIFSLDFFAAHAGGEAADHDCHGRARPADDRLAVADFRIDGDAVVHGRASLCFARSSTFDGRSTVRTVEPRIVRRAAVISDVPVFLRPVFLRGSAAAFFSAKALLAHLRENIL